MEEVTETILDLSHLTLQAQALAILPGAERINRIRSERWIGYTYAGQALMELENLFAWPVGNVCLICLLLVLLIMENQ